MVPSLSFVKEPLAGEDPPCECMPLIYRQCLCPESHDMDPHFTQLLFIALFAF